LRTRRNKVLKTRLITAAVALPALIYFVLKAPQEYFTVLIAVVAAVGVVELMMMYKAGKFMTAASALLGALCIMAHNRGMFAEALLASMLLIGAIRLFVKPSPEGALSDMAPALLGLLYVAGLMSFFLVLHKVHHGLVLFLLGTVWLSDASAYFIGTRFGKHKIYPSMSPKKSWEGAAASVIGGAIGALILGAIFLGQLLLFSQLLVSGLIIGAVAVIGDLVESMIKRDAGVKDSSSFIPGHGGLLDKIDGSLYCAPVLVYVLSAYGIITEGVKITLPF
jgi:phosphatidate cytidylyltransferase